MAAYYRIYPGDHGSGFLEAQLRMMENFND